MMPRGKKRKAASAVAVLESTETSGESQDSPLTQGRFVPRFTKKARTGRPASIKSTAVPVCSEEAEKREETLEDGGRTLQHSQPSTAIDHEVPVVQLDVGNLESPAQQSLALTYNNTTTTTSITAVCNYVPGLTLSQTVPSSPSNTLWATHTNDGGGNHNRVLSCDPSSDVIPDRKDVVCKDDSQNFQLLDLMGDDKDNEYIDDFMGDGKLSADKDQALIEESPVFTEELDLYHGEVKKKPNEATHLVSPVMATEKAFSVPPSSPDAVLPNGEETPPDAVLPDSQDDVETVSESLYSNVNINDGKNLQTSKGGDKDLNLATSMEDTSVYGQNGVHSVVATHPASTLLGCQAGTPLGTIGHQAGTSMDGDATPLHEAVREMMDLTAAELLESQFTDEAMVPSCSPASKTLARKAVDPLQHCLQEGIPGTSNNEGTRTLHGLIDELSALNRYILHCKKELDSARRQRNSWLKTRKGRRGGR